MKDKKTFKEYRWKRQKNHDRKTNDRKDIPRTKKSKSHKEKCVEKVKYTLRKK